MSEIPPRLPMPPEAEKEFGRGIRRAYEIQDGWSRGTLPETPELKAELEALREQDLDYRDRYEIGRETRRRVMGAGQQGSWFAGGQKSFSGIGLRMAGSQIPAWRRGTLRGVDPIDGQPKSDNRGQPAACF